MQNEQIEPDSRDEFLARKDICALLKCTRQKLYLMIKNGQFPPPENVYGLERWRRSTVFGNRAA